MVFLVIFALIAIIVIALNMKDSSNLDKIESYYKMKNCQNVLYSKGTYKGICKDEIVQIDNGFSIDLEKDIRNFKLDKIKKLDKKELKIIINEVYNIEFKDEKNRDTFYISLKEKLNNE